MTIKEIIMIIPAFIVIILITMISALLKPEKNIRYTLSKPSRPTFTDDELIELTLLLTPLGYIVIIEKDATQITIHPPMTQERQEEKRKYLLQLSEILKQ